MSDRELLELAAKAAGMDIDPERYDDAWGFALRRTATWWNPLADDGDALRLEVKLRMAVSVCQEYTAILDCKTREDHESDPYAATRRAIVRAAAEIGNGIQQQKIAGLPEDNYYKSQAEAEEYGRQMQEGGAA